MVTYLVPFDVWNTVRRQHHVHDVIDKAVLHDPVADGGGAEARRGVHLYQPRLEVVVDDDVVSVAFVAVAVRHHDRCHCLQAVHDQPVDLVEKLVACLLTARHFKEEAKVLHTELTAVDVVVLTALFLYGHVGQMDKQVVHFSGAVVVLHCAEPAEAELEHVDLKAG